MQYLSTNIIRNSRQNREDWFEQRRDFFIRQVLADFFQILRAFQDLYSVYLSCRKPAATGCSDLLDKHNEERRSQIWDTLTSMVGTEVDKGPLWKLKDLCHRIWPEDEHSHNLDGSLIDWLIGSIFHEAMKLKENIYILNSYGPAATRFSEPGAGDGAEGGLSEIPVPGLVQMMDSKGLIRRIVADVISQMDQLAFLFGQSSYMLRTMLPGLSGNMLVIRLLVEQEDVVREVWGEEVEEVFTDIFFGAPEQGFCAAGRSYMNGQWYGRSLAMYQRARAVDGSCDEAVAKVYQLQAIIRQNGELLGAQ